MAGNKYSSELLLQGKFEFDQNSLSSAAQFTQELVKTIEGPLQEMTQRIVSNLFGRQGLGQGFQSALVDQYGKPITSSQAPGGLPPVQGGPTGSPPPVGAATSPIQGVGNIFPPGQGPTSAAFQEYVKTQFRPIDFGELKAGITSAVGRPYSPEFEARNMALMMQKAQGAGVDVYSTMTSEQKEQFKTAANTMQTRISEAIRIGQAEQASKSGNIKSVEDAMAAIEDHMSRMPDRLGQAYKEAQNELVALQKEHVRLQKDASDAAEQTAAGIQELKRAKDALEAPGRAEQEAKAADTMRRLGLVSTGLGMASSLAAFTTERPYALEEARAARAGMERGGARALLSGDMIRYGLIQELGGEEALTARSITSARSGYAAGALGSLAGGGLMAMIGSGMISGIGAGAVGGLPGAIIGGLAGLGGAAYMGYKGIFEPEESAKGYYEREISARAGKSQEVRAAMSTSYDRLRGSFRTARDLGDVGLEAMLYGGSTTSLTSGQIKTGELEERLYPEKESISNFIDRNIGRGVDKLLDTMGVPESFYRSSDAQIRKAREAAGQPSAISAAEREKEYFRKGLVQDESGNLVDLNTYAAKFGVDYSEIGAPLAGAFGQKLTGGMAKEAIALKSLGVGPETIAGFGAGELRQDPRDAFNRVKDLYAEAMSTGIEKSQLPRAMEAVAQQAAGIGIGGGAQAGEAFRRATGLAGAEFGTGYGAAQLSSAQRVEQLIFGRGGTFGGGGMGGAGRVLGAQEVMGKEVLDGKSLTDLMGGQSGMFMELLSKGGMTEAGLKKGLQQFLPDMSEEQINQIIKAQGGLEGIKKTISGGALGIPEAGRQAITGLGATTFDAAVAEREMAADKSLQATIEKSVKEGAGAGLKGEVPTTPGGVAVSSELGVKATELNTALVKVIETVPSFTEAVKNAVDGINKGLQELYPTINRAGGNQSFGNGD